MKKNRIKNIKTIKNIISSILIIFIIFPSTINATETEEVLQEANSELFTEEELAMIEALPTLKVGYLTDSKPIAETDKNGEYQGMTREIFDLIAEEAGISVEYVPLTRENQTEAYLNEHGIHIIANYEYKGENAVISLESVVRSIPYLELNQIFVVPQDTVITSESVLRVAASERILFSAESMKKDYPNLELTSYDTLDECFQAVKKGEADIILGNRYRVEPYLSQPQNGRLQMVQARNIDSECCVALVNCEENADQFIGIVNKAISQLSEDDINTIVLRNASNNIYRYGIKDFVYQYRYLLIMLFVLVVIIVILVIRAMQAKKRALVVIMKKNEQLAEAMEAANSANRAKSDFLARMSHELRTPMNAIIGLTTVAKKETDEPKKIADYLHKIETSSRILLGIINDILDMSAIEKEKIKIVEDEFNVEELVKNIAEIYQEQCAQKQIKFEVSIDTFTDKILIGDSLRVNQILMNLLSNAVKFTESGQKIEFQILQEAVSADSVAIKVIVADTGCGMSEDLQKRLFLPFEQEDATAAAKHTGSGLGLAISKRLVNLMGGKIQVESEKEKGTIFVVNIPFKRIAEQKERVQKEEIDWARELGGHKVLVAEDIELNMQVIVLLLEMVGIETDCAEDGERAVALYEKAEAGEYDAVLLDINMPKMDGYETARAIRTSQKKDAKTIPIYSMTANAFAKDAREALETGMNGHIVKPIEADSLYRTLQMAFAKKENETDRKQKRLNEAGIDVEEGIQRFAGNQKVYEKYLYEFPTYPYFGQLETALSEKRGKDAFQAAHALKGVAGNLSMKPLYDEIRPLVEDLRGEPDIDGAMEKLDGVKKQYLRMVEVVEEIS